MLPKKITKNRSGSFASSLAQGIDQFHDRFIGRISNG
jgi:hypothetical protein